jgi:acyl-CoA synthetase (AMP-forming)/AMP-acid ligase II
MKLGTLVSSNAQRYPDRVALVCDRRRVTFQELDLLSNRIANALLQHGLRGGDRVGVHLPNGIELVVTVCGILKAGGVVVPISTRLAAAEIAVMLEDSMPTAIVFSAGSRAMIQMSVATLPKPLLIADELARPGELDLNAIMTTGSPLPVAPPSPEFDDALIAYTSGTTGRPKGAISTHANLIIGQGMMTARAWGLRSDDVILVTTPMAHRIGIARISNAIYLGARLAIMPRFDAVAAIDLIETEGVTVVALVPTIARMLIPAIESRPQACRTLRVIVATGEAFPEDMQRRLIGLLPRVRIYGFYSQTEAGFVASLSPEDRFTHPDSVGQPVPGVEIRIVDADWRDVSVGSPGEILVRCGRPGQYSVMRAYYNQPDATAEVFVDGWLRTGDIGRLDHDNFLYFVDRAKDMIISGGLNVYSREVELAIAKHDAVAEVAVIGVPDDEFGEAVMAFVEIAPGRAITQSELIDHCRQHIAGYKKPKHVRFVDALPRNATGKVIKSLLRGQAASVPSDVAGTALTAESERRMGRPSRNFG